MALDRAKGPASHLSTMAAPATSHRPPSTGHSDTSPRSFSLAAISGPAWARIDLLVDLLDDALLIDVERPAIGEAPLRVQHAVVLGDALVGIAENRVIQIERLGEPLVFLGRVDARCEIGDFQVVEGLAVLTERLAFLGAPAGKRPWETTRSQLPTCP